MTPFLVLEDLFEKADREGLWFYTTYGGIWFTPDELRAENAKGNFRWGPVNFQLRDPIEFLQYHDEEIEKAKTTYADAGERYRKYAMKRETVEKKK